MQSQHTQQLIEAEFAGSLEQPTAFETLAESLKGKDVILSGSTASGRAFHDRVLKNVTLKRAGNDGLVVGWSEEAGGVRSFKFSKLVRMDLV